MNPIAESLTRGVEQLLGRASGPLHFRLIFQPIVATTLAIRAGLRDAREGNSAFFWTLLTSPSQRYLLIHSGWKDIGTLYIVAAVLDFIYQIFVLGAFHPLQTMIVCVCVAVLPYLLLRGPVMRIARMFERPKEQPAKAVAP